MSVLGTISPDLIGGFLGSDYDRYSSPTGINGLAKSEDGRLDILVVDATKPGTGQLREFIKQCKAEYEVVIIWEVWNKGLVGVLERYGFKPYDENDPLTHEHLTGMRWDENIKVQRVRRRNRVGRNRSGKSPTA